MTIVTSKAWAGAWVLALACRHPDAPPPDRQAPIAVTASPVHEEPLPVLYRASGIVRGRATVVVSSKITGYVRAVHVHPGDRVEAGQVVAELEANDTRAGVHRQQAELARATDVRAEAEHALEAARATAELANRNLERDQRLVEGGAIPRQAFEQRQAAARAATADAAAAEARLRQATTAIEISRATLAEQQAMLDYTRVVAPFAGRVLERRVDPGALASPGTALLVVDDGGRPRIEAAVEEGLAPHVKLGDPVSVELANRPRPVAGVVGEVVPSVDVQSRAFTVKVDLGDDAGALQPGAFARVELAIGSRARLVVKTSAITALGALDRVYVIEDGSARLRMIARGEARGPWTEVLSGLSPGEQVADDPVQLHDGERVEVRR